MASYLDKAGLSYMWSKLKPLIEGKADASHAHDAGEITSGTFNTARIPSLAASKITSGTFGVSRGGTGKSSVTAGSYLIGNGTGAMTEKTPAEVLAHIGAAAASHGHDAASSSAAGFMSAADKEKLDGIATGANKITVDSSLSSTSTNPVQNKVINSALAGKAASSHGHDAATTGAAGFMSAADKSKLDGIATGANKYTLPVATSSAIGGVKSGTDITVDSSGNVSINDDSHNHVISNIDGLQTALNGKETSGAAATALTDAKAYTDTKISDLINSAPTTLDTLGEIAAAMEENADVVAALETAIGSKADASHTHAAGDVTSGTFAAARIPSLAASKITSGTFGVARGGTGKSSVTAGNYLVGNGTSAMTEKTPAEVLSDIGAAASGHSHGAATASAAGFMSADDKSKLDGIATGATKITVDSALSSTSTNPVQNKVINSALAGKAASSHNHAASEITSGTLSVARGGTGVTANPSMLINLGSTTAASVFAASPRPGVTGTLPIANGGTGATTADAALANLGVNSITNAEIDELMA